MKQVREIKDQANAFHWAWIILITCFVNLFLNYSARLGFGIILPEMIRSLDLSRTAGGSIYNSYLFTYITITPFTGILTDRLGGRRVITACCLFVGVGLILMGTTQGLVSACLFYAIVGIGASGMWTPVITIVQRWFSPHRRGLALGILSTGYGLGFATLGVVFPWIVSHFSWRFGWYSLGVGMLVMVFINGLLLRSSPEDVGFSPWGQKEYESNLSSVRSHTAVKDSIFRTIFRSKTFWIIGISYLLIAYGLYGITTFMVDYAKYQLGLDLEKASFLATVHGSSQVLGVLIIVPISDYLTRKKTLIVSNTFIMASLIGILFAGRSWVTLIILIGILGTFYGAVWPLYGACAGDYFPRELMGTVIGAWTPLYGFGAIMVHWITGMIRDATGSYDFAFIICIITIGLSIALMCLVKPARKDTLSTL